MPPDNLLFSRNPRQLLLGLIFIIVVFPHYAWGGGKITQGLTLADCPKCHPAIAAANKRNGRAHRDKVTCLNCHVGHPPAKWGIIPHCSRCHKKGAQEHFGLKNCLRCHRNPHTPLRITLPEHATKPCLTCHKTQIKQLKKYPSMHSTFYCTSCHPRHGYKPTCFACHAGHLPYMTMADCRGCHKAHMPLHVTYGDKVPSEYCGACHKKEYRLLAASHAKHRRLTCVTCHSRVHKTIPKCTKCHNPPPHDPGLLKHFKSCLTCHVNPHDLQLNQIDIDIQREKADGQKNKTRP